MKGERDLTAGLKRRSIGPRIEASVSGRGKSSRSLTSLVIADAARHPWVAFPSVVLKQSWNLVVCPAVVVGRQRFGNGEGGIRTLDRSCLL